MVENILFGTEQDFADYKTEQAEICKQLGYAKTTCKRILKAKTEHEITVIKRNVEARRRKAERMVARKNKRELSNKLMKWESTLCYE